MLGKLTWREALDLFVKLGVIATMIAGAAGWTWSRMTLPIMQNVQRARRIDTAVANELRYLLMLADTAPDSPEHAALLRNAREAARQVDVLVGPEEVENWR